jgi:hypothetical protein
MTAAMIATEEDHRIAAAVTALCEGLPREVLDGIIAGMSVADRLNLIDVVQAHRARR